jgi:hypothetical protein
MNGITNKDGANENQHFLQAGSGIATFAVQDIT